MIDPSVDAVVGSSSTAAKIPEVVEADLVDDDAGVAEGDHGVLEDLPPSPFPRFH